MRDRQLANGEVSQEQIRKQLNVLYEELTLLNDQLKFDPNSIEIGARALATSDRFFKIDRVKRRNQLRREIDNLKKQLDGQSSQNCSAKKTR